MSRRKHTTGAPRARASAARARAAADTPSAIRRLAAGLTLAAGIAATAWLTTSAQETTRMRTNQPAAPSAAGQRAFIDPVTGALREPEHEELAALAAQSAAAAPARRTAAARTANAAAEFFLPDGSIGAVVPEDLHTFTVATRGPDGRIVIEHAQGAAQAESVMKANSAKTTAQASASRTQQKEDRHER